MIHTAYSELQPVDYFRSIYTDAMFVKHSDHAQAVLLNGLTDPMDFFEFDGHQLVVLLDCESEWPTIDYKPEIRSWNWEKIKAKAKSNILVDEHEPYESAWIGTTLGVMPSGKIYAPWTSNQTAEDVNRDQQFNEAMEEVFHENGMFVSWGESGDLFATRHTSFQEVAERIGFLVEEDVNEPGTYIWTDGTEEGYASGFQSEEEAWDCCCHDNRLVQS